jgi:hypothetical protein
VPYRAWRFESSQPHRSASASEEHSRVCSGTCWQGATASEISRQLGVSRETVRGWLAGVLPHSAQAGVCADGVTQHRFDELTSDYVYLPGLYLGDGCISTAPRDVYKLRIVLDVKYPGIIDTASAALTSVRGKASGIQVRPRNRVELYSYWRSWPCLFPQHAAGRSMTGRSPWSIG